MKKLMIFSLVIMLITSCNSGTKKMGRDLTAFIDTLELKVQPV